MRRCAMAVWASINTLSIAAVLLVQLLAPGIAAATTSFSAHGNEPNWHVEVTDSGITFKAMNAQTFTISPKPKAQVTADSETYLASVDGQPFTLTIKDKLCVDTMSGMPFPKTVGVALGEREHAGCGGDPASLLRGSWSIDQIAGEEVVVESQPTIDFGDGQISGNGSCNRYFGSFALTGESIKISDLGSSMMACDQPLMQQETLLLSILRETSRFDIDSDGRLVLHSISGKSVVARRK